MSPDVPQVDATAGAALIADGALLLDVRESDEWEAGHSASATHVPLAEVPGHVAELQADRRVVVICRVGGRSQRAAEFLRQQGIDAVNLSGGMRAWAASGLDVVTPDGRPGAVI